MTSSTRTIPDSVRNAHNRLWMDNGILRWYQAKQLMGLHVIFTSANIIDSEKKRCKLYMTLIGIHSTMHLMHPNKLMSCNYCMCVCVCVCACEYSMYVYTALHVRLPHDQNKIMSIACICVKLILNFLKIEMYTEAICKNII